MTHLLSTLLILALLALCIEGHHEMHPEKAIRVANNEATQGFSKLLNHMKRN